MRSPIGSFARIGGKTVEAGASSAGRAGGIARLASEGVFAARTGGTGGAGSAAASGAAGGAGWGSLAKNGAGWRTRCNSKALTATPIITAATMRVR